MKTRIGKIARLPLEIREQLNHRLQNGETGSAILNWLNQLPATAGVLAEQFDAQPINKQNLSDWRQGGYQDWLRHQDRQTWSRRVCEQGDQLETVEGANDLYDCFSRIVLAEMAEDLEYLHDLANREERSKRLHLIARDLARLQNAFNHSKRVELEITKRNDRYAGDDSGTGILPVPTQQEAGEENGACNRRGNEADSQTVKPSQGESSPATPVSPPTKPKLPTVIKNIRHRQCSRGCVCQECHPDDGDYPYAQALQDDQAKQPHSSDYWTRGNTHWLVFHTDCPCYCHDCATRDHQPSPGTAGVPPARAINNPTTPSQSPTPDPLNSP